MRKRSLPESERGRNEDYPFEQERIRVGIETIEAVPLRIESLAAQPRFCYKGVDTLSDRGLFLP